MEKPEGPFCQCCGMPLQREEDFGTNADGSKNYECCHFCFQNGEFTQPDMTQEEMIENVAKMMAVIKHVPREQAKEVAATFIPLLKSGEKS